MYAHVAAAKRLEALSSKPYMGVVASLTGLVGGAEHNGKLAAVRRYKPEKVTISIYTLCP